MRRRSDGLSLRGFIVLADILFALAAGFLLLHPPAAPRSAVVPPPGPPACADCAFLEQKLQRLLDEAKARSIDIELLAAKPR